MRSQAGMSLVGLALSLALGLAACTAPVATVAPASAPPTATPPRARALRVVALSSLSADIIHRLDRTKLVGISGSRLLSQNPELAQLPRVSEERTPPNLEKIAALKPDLVIGAAGFHDSVLAKLKDLNIPTIATQVNGWQALEALTRELAAAIGTDPAPLLQSYQAMRNFRPTGNPATLVLVSEQPIQAPNRSSWAGDLLAQFAAHNVVADLQGNSPLRGYVTLSPEKVLDANPDVLIVVDPDNSTLTKLQTAPFWKQLKAVQTNRIHVFDYYGLVNPGSIAAIEQACTQLKQVLSNQTTSQN